MALKYSYRKLENQKNFNHKTFKHLLKEYEIELYSRYSDLKAVFMERFNRTLLSIINKPMFMNGDSNCVNLLNDAVVPCNIIKHSSISMTPVINIINSES